MHVVVRLEVVVKNKRSAHLNNFRSANTDTSFCGAFKGHKGVTHAHINMFIWFHTSI